MDCTMYGMWTGPSIDGHWTEVIEEPFVFGTWFGTCWFLIKRFAVNL